jgi:hypothetical protein
MCSCARNAAKRPGICNPRVSVTVERRVQPFHIAVQRPHTAIAGRQHLCFQIQQAAAGLLPLAAAEQDWTSLEHAGMPPQATHSVRVLAVACAASIAAALLLPAGSELYLVNSVTCT